MSSAEAELLTGITQPVLSVNFVFARLSKLLMTRAGWMRIEEFLEIDYSDASEAGVLSSASGFVSSDG
jgi:hypothetical protein